MKPLDQPRQQLLARYCDAFERSDVDTLVSLLHQDATMSMPPFHWWLRGRAVIRCALLAAGRPCEGVRLVPTMANGCAAYAQYRPSGPLGAYEPFGLTVVELRGPDHRDDDVPQRRATVSAVRTRAPISTRWADHGAYGTGAGRSAWPTSHSHQR